MKDSFMYRKFAVRPRGWYFFNALPGGGLFDGGGTIFQRSSEAKSTSAVQSHRTLCLFYVWSDPGRKAVVFCLVLPQHVILYTVK